MKTIEIYYGGPIYDPANIGRMDWCVENIGPAGNNTWYWDFIHNSETGRTDGIRYFIYDEERAVQFLLVYS